MKRVLARWRGVVEVIVAVLLAAIASSGITYGLQYAMATSDPLVVVVSGSMVPTLEVGDLVVIQGSSPGEVRVGDIVVFHSPASYDEKIIHRVVKVETKYDLPGGTPEIWFTTRGDHNSISLPGVDYFSSRNLIGRAVFWFKYLGYPAMLLENKVGEVPIVRALLWAGFIALVAYNVYQQLPRKKQPEEAEKPDEASTYKNSPEA